MKRTDIECLLSVVNRLWLPRAGGVYHRMSRQAGVISAPTSGARSRARVDAARATDRCSIRGGNEGATSRVDLMALLC